MACVSIAFGCAVIGCLSAMSINMASTGRSLFVRSWPTASCVNNKDINIKIFLFIQQEEYGPTHSLLTLVSFKEDAPVMLTN